MFGMSGSHASILHAAIDCSVEGVMALSRRDFGRLALTAIPAAAVMGRSESVFGAFVRAKPNSLINGVQVGTITYSYRSMPDQSAEATLRYIVDSGISAIELMNGPAESYAGAPSGRGGDLKQWRLSVSM